MNRYKTTEQNINGTTIEKLENYDKGEQIMIQKTSMTGLIEY